MTRQAMTTNGWIHKSRVIHVKDADQNFHAAAMLVMYLQKFPLENLQLRTYKYIQQCTARLGK